VKSEQSEVFFLVYCKKVPFSVGESSFFSLAASLSPARTGRGGLERRIERGRRAGGSVKDLALSFFILLR